MAKGNCLDDEALEIKVFLVRSLRRNHFLSIFTI